MLLVVLLGSFIGGDVNRLDSDLYADREEAHGRLRSWGLMAVPKLLKGMGHESAEMRMRCNDLLAPYRKLTWDIEAAGILLAPALPDNPFEFFDNGRLRLHVFRMAEAAGCSPDIPIYGMGWTFKDTWDLDAQSCAWTLDMFRQHIAWMAK